MELNESMLKILKRITHCIAKVYNLKIALVKYLSFTFTVQGMVIRRLWSQYHGKTHYKLIICANRLASNRKYAAETLEKGSSLKKVVICSAHSVNSITTYVHGNSSAFLRLLQLR